MNVSFRLVPPSQAVWLWCHYHREIATYPKEFQYFSDFASAIPDGGQGQFSNLSGVFFKRNYLKTPIFDLKAHLGQNREQ